MSEGGGEGLELIMDGRRRAPTERTAQIIIRVRPELKARALGASQKLGRSLTGLIEGYLEDLVRRVGWPARVGGSRTEDMNAGLNAGEEVNE